MKEAHDGDGGGFLIDRKFDHKGSRSNKERREIGVVKGRKAFREVGLRRNPR
jgi:hypothetical protein